MTKLNIPYKRNCCKDCDRAYCRAYYLLNREKHAKATEKWRKEHPEKIRAMVKKYRLSHRKQVNKKHQEWYRNHVDEVSARRKRKLRMKKLEMLHQDPLIFITKKFFQLPDLK